MGNFELVFMENRNLIFFKSNNNGSNLILLKDKEDYVLIDTSIEQNLDEIVHILTKLEIRISQIKYVFLTHEHYDHIGNASFFKNAKIFMSRRAYNDIRDYSLGYDFVSKAFSFYSIDNFSDFLKDDSISCYNILKSFNIIKTSGHSAGSIVVFYKNYLFSGDSIFDYGMLPRTDFENSSLKDLLSSYKKVNNFIEKEMSLRDYNKKRIIVFPGHGNFFFLNEVLDLAIKNVTYYLN